MCTLIFFNLQNFDKTYNFSGDIKITEKNTGIINIMLIIRLYKTDWDNKATYKKSP